MAVRAAGEPADHDREGDAPGVACPRGDPSGPLIRASMSRPGILRRVAITVRGRCGSAARSETFVGRFVPKDDGLHEHRAFLRGMVSSDAPKNPTPATASSATDVHESLSAFVLLVGLTNGVAPLVVGPVFGADALLIALPLHLPSPWWWVASLTVLAATAALLELLDRAGRRAERLRDVDETGTDEHPDER